MAKEIEEYFVKRLQSYLLEYLQDFSQNNMAKFSLGISSNIILKNLQIKKQALLNFSFPMYIIDGKINSITINMPLNYKAQQPEMIIEGVDLQVCTIQEANSFVSNKEQQQQQGVENLKKHKLKIWEEQMAKYFEQLSPPNWIQKIVDGIYNNMSIQIKSFFLRFYNYSIFGCETQLKIKTDIYIKATDKQFQQKFNSDLNSIFKLIEIKKFGIMFFYQQTKKNDSSKGSPRAKKKEEQQLLSPIDITIKLTLNKNQEQLTKPLQNITVSIDNPVIFQINKETKNYLVKLNEVLQNLEIVQDNFHFRPKCEVKNNYGEWWKYLIAAVMQNQKNHKLDLGYSSRRLVLMKRYIELYKRKQTIILVPWLTSWTHQDETKFKKCEDNLSLKDLLKYREWAFQEIRIEAKRYYHSSKDGQNQQGVKPILEIWTNTINNQNSFKDQKKRDDDIPIELEDDEKINLYEILERDKTQVLSSYLKGQNNDPDQIKTQIFIKIHSIFFIILENRSQNLIQYGPKNTKIFAFCQCKKCIQLVKKPIVLDKKKQSFQPNPSLSEIVKQTQKYQNDEESFQTAKEIDSFYEDLEDLNNEESSCSQTSSQDQKHNNSQAKYNLDQVRINKVVLSISFIGIRIPVQIFQNGRVTTNEKDHGLITVGEIKFLTPGMMPKVMDDKTEIVNEEDRQSPLFEQTKWKDKFAQCGVFEEKSQQTSAKLSEFINEIFEVSISKDQSYFSSSEICFQTMCKFLESNQMINVSLFLIDYENDKHGFQDFSNEQFKKYDKYFVIPNDKDEEFDDSFLLHVIKHQKTQSKWSFLKEAAIDRTKQKADNCAYWTECQNKHRFLQEIHNKLIEIIKKSLFPLFLEDHGEKILPMCIINLKDKITYNINQGQPNFSLNLYLEGEKSEYRIAPNSEKKKREQQQQIIEEQQSNEYINVKFTPCRVFLSTKSLNSLIDFIESMDKTSLSQRQLYVTQDHKLLECILKSKPLGQETVKPPGLKFSVQLEGKQKFRIVSDQLSNLMKTELKFQVKNLSFSTIKLDELFQEKENNRDKPTLYKQHQKFFSAAKLTIKQFKIAHKYYSPDYYYKNEEMKSYEKEHYDDKKNNSTLKVPLSKQISSNYQQESTLFNKPQVQTLDPRQLKLNLSKQSSQQPFQLIQQSKKKDPKIHIKGIKQTILKMQLVAIQLNAKVENHALLTDQKLYIQIPFFNLRLNDSFVCFIEVLQILQQHLKNDTKPQYKNKIGQDSLLKAELDTLFHDHKEQNSDCKHCILKYRKTIELTNILFGVIQDFSKESFDFPCWFHILHKLLKEVDNSSDNSHKKHGIKISFQSTEKGTNHGQYKSVIAFSKFAITRDLGYFKDNIMIHCSATTFKNDGIVLKSAQKLEDIESNINSNTQFERNNQSFQQPSQQASHRSSQMQNLPEKLKKEKNYILIQPAYQVKEPLQFWSKLDDKFIFYCRSNEKDMFKTEINVKEFEDNNLFDSNSLGSLQPDEDFVKQSVSSVNSSSLFILFYCNRPLRSELIQNKDQNRNEKSNKKKFFFQLSQIKAVFCNQYAACNILTTVRNISRIDSIFQKVHKIFNTDQQQQIPTEQNKLQESPIKLLDDMIISACIQNIFLKSNESYFKLQWFKIMLNLDLMSAAFNIKSSGHNKNSSSLGQETATKQKVTNFALCDDLIIMKCQSIKFNFNTVSIVEVKLLHIKKLYDTLFFEVEDIQISIKNKFTGMSENLLTMPSRDKAGFQRSLFALHTRKLEKQVALSIKLEFQNQNPRIYLTIQQGQIQLSQQLVQDLLIAVNSFYLINLEEQISLRQHLLKYIFKQELEKSGISPQSINLFAKDQTVSNSQLYFILELDVEVFQIALQQKDIVFFNFEFHNIKVKKKLNQDLEIDVNLIELKPQSVNGEIVNYQNLLLLNGNHSNQQMKFKLENKIIHIENVKFFMISKYLNELDAFIFQIETILQKNKEDLAERYQSDFDLQLQMKQQETLEYNKEDLQLIVQIKNSQIIVPQSSNGQNLIKIKFISADLKVLKDMVVVNIPDIMEKKIEIINEKQLIVDYEDKINQLDQQELFITKLDAQLKQVEVDYEVFSDQEPNTPITGVLLYSDFISTYLNLPSFEQYLGTSGWKYKDCCKLVTQSLQMSLDLGKLLKVQGFVEENMKEKSSLFEFQQSKLKKISFNLSLTQMTVQLTRYQEVEKDKVEKMKNQKFLENKSHRQSKQFSQVKQNKKQQDF